MRKGLIIGGAVVGMLVVVGVIVAVMAISYRNNDARLRNLITAKQTDNKSEFDNMFKKISQSVQVTEAQMTALKGIFVEHAQARGGAGNAKIMSWIQESVPNVDTKVYTNLQNIIIASRDSWTMRQKELIDYKREHDNLIDTFPSGWFLSLMGRGNKIDITIVTSTKTEKAFETGKDDDVEIFKK